MQLIDVDDNKGDVWLVLKDAGFDDDVNVVLTLDQAEELYGLLGYWLQDCSVTKKLIKDAKKELADTRLEDKVYEY